jgi:hypothetical protein
LLPFCSCTSTARWYAAPALHLMLLHTFTAIFVEDLKMEQLWEKHVDDNKITEKRTL